MHKYLDNYAPDPFNKSFNIDYLKSNLLKRKKNIKNILLDQKIISGIGNIYASEILFYAKINPNKKGHQLSIISLKNLLKFCKFVLKKSISRGGSSIQNFKNINSNPGFYQNDFKVYDREDKKCFSLNCNLKIKKIIISNRSTFYCKNCQK